MGQKSVKQRKEGTAFQQRKELEQRCGARGARLGAARRAQGSGSAREIRGFQLSPCRQSRYRSYFSFPVFGVQVSHTLDIPDCRINQMANIFL